MKPREVVLPFITSVLIFSTSVFISCASQERVEGNAGFEETAVADNQPVDNGDLTDLGADTPPDLGLTPEGDVATTSDETATQDLATETPAADLTTETAEAPAGGELNVDELGLPSDSTLSETPAPQEGAVSEQLSETPPAEQIAEAPAAPQQSAPPSGAEQDVLGLPTDAAIAAATTSEPTTAGYSDTTVRAPRIPKKAKMRGKVALNRVYFLRKGDTAKSVAELIYGSPESAAKLKKWNGGGWKPGKMIFYSSVLDPNDKAMRSFFEERHISPEQYVVKRGDWLSRIAQKKLGSIRSWKEIAALNGLSDPNAIEPGQQLAIFPVDLNGREAPIADKRQLVENRDVAPTVEVPSPVQMPSGVENPDQEEPAAEAAQTAPTKPSKKSGEMDFAKLIEQNLFMIVVGVGLAVLLVALLAVRSRRKAAEDSGSDDGFASPKAKRR